MRISVHCFIVVLFVSLASFAEGSELFTPSYLPYSLKTAEGQEMTWDKTFSKVEPIQVNANALFHQGVSFNAKSNFANKVDFRVEGITHRASLQSFEYRSDESYSWFGKVAGSDFLSHFAVLNGKMAGEIWLPTTTPGGFHRSILSRGGQQFIVQWNDEEVGKSLSGCQVLNSTSELLTTTTSSRRRPVRIPGPCGPGEVQMVQVDLLYLYDSSALAWFSNAQTAEAELRVVMISAVDAINATIVNSRAGSYRVTLVGMEKVTYVSVGAEMDDLNWIRMSKESSDLKELHKADVTGFWVGKMNGGAGVALLFNSSETYSHHVVTVGGGTEVAVHEFAHNIGDMHQPEVSSPLPDYPFAQGHHVNAQFRDAVSYWRADLCPDGCPTIPVLSNPSVLFNGIPTGIKDKRENWRMVAIAFPVISEYRSGSRTACITKNNGKVQFSE